MDNRRTIGGQSTDIRRTIGGQSVDNRWTIGGQFCVVTHTTSQNHCICKVFDEFVGGHRDGHRDGQFVDNRWTIIKCWWTIGGQFHRLSTPRFGKFTTKCPPKGNLVKTT